MLLEVHSLVREKRLGEEMLMCSNVERAHPRRIRFARHSAPFSRPEIGWLYIGKEKIDTKSGGVGVGRYAMAFSRSAPRSESGTSTTTSPQELAPCSEAIFGVSPSFKPASSRSASSKVVRCFWRQDDRYVVEEMNGFLMARVPGSGQWRSTRSVVSFLTRNCCFGGSIRTVELAGLLYFIGYPAAVDN